MRRECKMVYTYDELSDEAKAAAREWFATDVFACSADYEFVYDDAVHMGNLLGIEIDTHPVRLMGGGTRDKPTIYFSGFYSQGDGACFEGRYRYAKGAVKAITEETGGTDKELIRIATELQSIQRKNFYRLVATCKHRGHYYHSGCMAVEVEDREDRYRDIGEAEEDIRQLMRDFADWIYEQLEQEYDYQTSDKVVAETIIANEYEFYENGERL